MCAELGARGVVEVRQATRVEAVQVLVERVDEDAERQVALQLGRAAGQDQAALAVGARLELGQQPGLAHPRLADAPRPRRTRGGLAPARRPALRAGRRARPAARLSGRIPDGEPSPFPAPGTVRQGLPPMTAAGRPARTLGSMHTAATDPHSRPILIVPVIAALVLTPRARRRRKRDAVRLAQARVAPRHLPAVGVVGPQPLARRVQVHRYANGRRPRRRSPTATVYGAAAGPAATVHRRLGRLARRRPAAHPRRAAIVPSSDVVAAKTVEQRAGRLGAAARARAAC